MPELVISRGSRELLRVPLSPRGLKIGRSSQNDVILPDDDISRQHASIEYIEGNYILKDGSTGGTRVSGQLIKEHSLSDRDEISIGPFKLGYCFHGLVDEQKEGSVLTIIRDQNQEATRVISLKDLDLEVEQISLAIKGRAPIKVSKLPFVMGSLPENQLVLEDEYVSSRHCEIIRRDGALLLRDLNSTNGTLLNSRRVSEVGLKKGDEIRVGKTIVEVMADKTPARIKPINQDFFCGMVGGHSLQTFFGKISRVAPTDLTVLIQAESGCGKELAARAVHDLSLVAKGPYVIVNCGAISSELIESELFGHEKGAFTGAMARRIGAFEQAHNGTLFLDEIGELPLNLQPKLLRALENRTIRRVGGENEIKVNVRVVAATHRSLPHMVEAGKFREDLFFRLNVIWLTLPPLRDRKEDIPLLCDHFLRLSDPGGTKRLSPEALEKLRSHDWPGNVRELRNILLKALVFADGMIEGSDIEFVGITGKNREVSQGDGLVDLGEVEQQKIREALEMAGGQKKKAAELLGIARSTLFKKLKEYDIE